MAYVFREYRSNGKPWCIAYKGLDGRLRREKTDAPTKELAKRLLARKLVEARQAHGRFSNWAQVDAVPGVGGAKLETLQAATELREAPSPGPLW